MSKKYVVMKWCYFNHYHFHCFEIEYLKINILSLRAEYIATVQQDTELCSRLSKNVALYMEKVRNAVVCILHFVLIMSNIFHICYSFLIYLSQAIV